MKPWLVRLGFLGVLVALGVWGWRALFPGPEQVIRKQLTQIARLACITPNEAPLVKLAKAQKLAAFFTTDTEIAVDLPGRFPQGLNGRDEVMQAVVSARTALSSLKVEFLDIGVTVSPDRTTGQAHFTAKADLPGETTPEVEELEARFKLVDGDWLIQRVQNVKTLR